MTVGFLNLTLSAIIMAMISALNRGSLKLVILYHYTITASSILLGALYLAVAVALLKKSRATLTMFEKETTPCYSSAK